MERRGNKKQCPVCKNLVNPDIFDMHVAECFFKSEQEKGNLQHILNQSQSYFNQQNNNNNHQNINRNSNSNRNRDNNNKLDMSEKTQCPNCSDMIKFSDLHIHEKECQNREFPCEYCAEQFPKDLMESHMEFCDKKKDFDRFKEKESRIQQQQQRQQQQQQHITREQQNRRSQNNNNNSNNQQRQSQEMQSPINPILQMILGGLGPRRVLVQQRSDQNSNSLQQMARRQQQQVQQQLDQDDDDENNNDEEEDGRQMFNPLSMLFRGLGEQNQQQQQQQIQIQQQERQRPANNPGLMMLRHLLMNGNLEGHDFSNNGGVSRDNLQEFPVTKFKKRPGQEEDQLKCAICMCEYEEDEDIKIINCLHKYHVECIDKWLEKNSTCPVCKHDVRQA